MTSPPISAQPEPNSTSEPPEPVPQRQKKAVGFAPLPEDDLKEHHDALKAKEDEKRKSNSFHKMPPELSYLNKKTAPPKPLPTESSRQPASQPPTQPASQPDSSLERPQRKVLGDFKKVHVKEMSVIHKDTELNFHFPTIELPIPAHNVLVSIKYASLNSFDISKLNKYSYNLSDTALGLGYEFAGEVVDVGKNNKDFAKGDLVMGILSPWGRKGALSSTLLLNSSKDFMVKIDELTLERLSSVDACLRLDSGEEGAEHQDQEAGAKDKEAWAKEDKEFVGRLSPDFSLVHKINARYRSKKTIQYPVEPTLPPLAKVSTIPVLYCRAKQALQHLNQQDHANIMINGADTNLAFTIIQLLTSSQYSFQTLNLVLIVKESNLSHMKKWVEYFKSKAAFGRVTMELVTFDLMNEDIVLPGEKTPINYKKPDLMAVDVLEAMFKNTTDQISVHNVNNHKLDLIIDISGSHFLHKTSIRFKKLDYLNFPVVQNLEASTKISQLFNADVKDPFFVKILKSKASGSGYVSMCNFGLKEPSYSIDTLIDPATQASEQSLFNPWSGWASNIANSFIKYNYYDEINLATKREWIVEGLNLFLKGELKFKLDGYVDWRYFLKEFVKEMRKWDGKMVFKVEDF